MSTRDFPSRYGYQGEHPVFQGADHLPDVVRRETGLMMIELFEDFMVGVRSERNRKMPYGSNDWIGAAIAGGSPDKEASGRFAVIVRDALPASEGLWEWYKSVNSMLDPDGDPWSTEYRSYRQTDVRNQLVRPLLDCDWRLFYGVVQSVYEALELEGYLGLNDFVSDFNFLLRTQQVPWLLQSGWVVPAADNENAAALSHAREVAHPSISEDVRDPHALIRDALDSLYRKPGGPAERTAACVHAWGAWKAIAGVASGLGARDGRTFKWVEERYPQLGATMAAWKPLAEQGRHPETGEPPTESETRLIVMLCVSVVRYLCPTCNPDDAP